ncbi:phosphonate C-P lyase system protein PhnG [Halopenitus persicus]|uniref:Alpha-D-ribose 1-methylphosphonate 5-triphosphate synthase subunit PhnG n=1 Tax=Halopenitus persicus TaxID=1048396 RepID=A0A1H3LI73_9EURY|nr:phosphonate C-P lyase system protein PhnG [Halopenitus persicus]SDY64093.1 alpha-D-ribose 1-methylphosphonate 5-triphosphate synthase subunit PhnG [Halopenitus persicus]
MNDTDETTLEDRTARFERIAASETATLLDGAEAVLDGETDVRVVQSPSPKLVMQRATDPVSGQPFNLGEVLVTTSEVELSDVKGFAMVPGKAERKALAGAVVDAAVAADHPVSRDLRAALADDAANRAERRQRAWAESRATTVDFDVMEDPA